MSDSNYWNDKYWPRVITRRLSRRRLIQIGGMGAASAMAAAYLGCGGGEEATGDATPSLAEFVSPTATVFWRRWFGPASAPGKIQWDGQLNTLSASAPDVSSITLATSPLPDGDEMYIEDSAWAADVSMAYFPTRNGLGDGSYHLIRFDPANNSYTAYTSPSSEFNSMALCVVSGQVFVAHMHVGIPQVRVSVFATASSPPVLLADHEYDVYASAASISTDGTYLFVGDTFLNIHVIAISDMSLKSSLHLSTGGGGLEPNVHSLYYDSVSGCLFASAIYSGYVFKLHLSGETLIEDANVYCGPFANVSVGNNMAVANGYLWLPFEAYLPGGRFGRIPVSSFDTLDVFPCGIPGQGTSGIAADPDGVHLWLTSFNEGTTAMPRLVSKFNMNDFTEQRIWLPDETANPGDILEYAPGKFLLPTWTDPAQIINLSLVDSATLTPASGTNHSYWAPLRPYVETTPNVSVVSPLAYTDGANGLGTGWTAVGARATEYTEPTGTPGVSGDALTTSAYPSLEGTPEDIFGWTAGSPKSLEGSLANPNTGDVGTAGSDECFLVLQLVAAPTVAPGLSNQETLTITHSDGTAPMSKTAGIRGKASIPAVAG